MFIRKNDDRSGKFAFTGRKTRVLQRISKFWASMSAIAVFATGITGTGCEEEDYYDELDDSTIMYASSSEGTAYQECIPGNTMLLPEDSLWSKNGEWVIKMQLDGNLVIYDTANRWKPTWSADNAYGNAKKAWFSVWGLYGIIDDLWNGHAFGYSKSGGTGDNKYWCMLNNGFLAAYDNSGETVWQNVDTSHHWKQLSFSHSIRKDHTVDVQMNIWHNFPTKGHHCTPTALITDKNGAAITRIFGNRTWAKNKKKKIELLYPLNDDEYSRIGDVHPDCYYDYEMKKFSDNQNSPVATIRISHILDGNKDVLSLIREK